jgi:hypothetical protein
MGSRVPGVSDFEWYIDAVPPDGAPLDVPFTGVFVACQLMPQGAWGVMSVHLSCESQLSDAVARTWDLIAARPSKHARHVGTFYGRTADKPEWERGYGYPNTPLMEGPTGAEMMSVMITAELHRTWRDRRGGIAPPEACYPWEMT